MSVVFVLFLRHKKRRKVCGCLVCRMRGGDPWGRSPLSASLSIPSPLPHSRLSHSPQRGVSYQPIPLNLIFDVNLAAFGNSLSLVYCLVLGELAGGGWQKLTGHQHTCALARVYTHPPFSTPTHACNYLHTNTYTPGLSLFLSAPDSRLGLHATNQTTHTLDHSDQSNAR